MGESEYKFHLLKEDQVNLLMGYDVNTGLPLFARMYRGACNDKSTIEDLTDLIKFSGEYFGVYVLQSNSAMTPEEIFSGYKKRWGIETFYQYLKNRGDYNDLMFQDYYKEQGFSFIMLIAGQIHQKMIEAIKLLHDNTISIRDILLMARCMKMEKRGNVWNLKNTRKKDLEIFCTTWF